MTQRGTVPVFHSSPRPSPHGGEGERSEGEEGTEGTAKCQAPMTIQVPVAECRAKTIWHDICVHPRFVSGYLRHLRNLRLILRDPFDSSDALGPTVMEAGL